MNLKLEMLLLKAQLEKATADFARLYDKIHKKQSGKNESKT